MPIIIQLTLEDDESQRFINANKILFFYRRKDDKATWLDIEDGGFFVVETPEQIDRKITAEKIHTARI
jgi:hypothetical protein